MARLESKMKMLEWKRIQRLGRRRIARATRDSSVRSLLFREALLPMSALGAPSLNLSGADANANANANANRKCAPVPVPPFLSMSSSSASSSDDVADERGFSFLTFPPEVRNLIYQYAVRYPTCRALFDSYYKRKEQEGMGCYSRGIRAKLQTPTILLLCKQVTREALTILRAQPFIIDRIPPWIPGHRLPLPITDFISLPTLQNILFFEFKVALGDGTGGSGYIWRRVLKYVLDGWSQRNSVVRLRVMFKLANIDVEQMWYWELRDYEKLVDNINNFEFRHAASPGTVQYEHWIMDCFYAYRTGFRNPLIRIHPDRDIWQGSVMEYV